jgi:hypothetical protein
MPIHRPWSQWVISLAVSAALLLAPVLPAVAFAPMADDTAHAAHASAADAGAGRSETPAPHADHGKAAGSGKTSSCDQHAACSKTCCAACAQCFTAAFTLSSSLPSTSAIQSPTVPRLHDRLTVAPHLRPPAA